ncbi:unnamed protein product [Choristocarpus tenellus]
MSKAINSSPPLNSCFDVTRKQGFPVTSVSLFGTLDTTEPQGPSHEEGSMFSESAGRRSPFTPRVRQGPGGNSSLVLG